MGHFSQGSRRTQRNSVDRVQRFHFRGDFVLWHRIRLEFGIRRTVARYDARVVHLSSPKPLSVGNNLQVLQRPLVCALPDVETLSL